MNGTAYGLSLLYEKAFMTFGPGRRFSNALGAFRDRCPETCQKLNLTESHDLSHSRLTSAGRQSITCQITYLSLRNIEARWVRFAAQWLFERLPR